MEKRSKICIIGSNGQLGTDLCKVLKINHQILPLKHKDIEISNFSSVTSALNKKNIDIVINTAAFHAVDLCEKKLNKAMQVNSYGVLNLAKFCKKNNIVLAHISTDYVFGADKERKKPYKETDLPNPSNKYGLSKLTGEYFIKLVGPKYFIVRTAGLYGAKGPSGKGKNFVDLMLFLATQGQTIRVVNDQFSSHTYTLDLAENIEKLISSKKYGMYHIANTGSCSWFEFAKKIFTLTARKPKLEAVSSKEFPTIARRPFYSVIDNFNLKQARLDVMPSWEKGLRRYLNQKALVI